MKWRDLIFPADRRFGPLLQRQGEVAVEACAALAADVPPARMAQVEAGGDAVRRALTEALAGTYATPFDRNDIFTLSSVLDDVVDAAQDALLAKAVFGAPEFAHVQEVCVSLEEGARALRDAVALLPHAAAQERARRAKRCENTVRNLYRYGMDLAIRTRPLQDVLRLREVLSELREVALIIGRAADLVADIAVKEK
ncbi:MAG TPA: DUF47 family protein [Bacillota bacterium]|nr:DUF47 family protein [Bacillota bacterium]